MSSLQVHDHPSEATPIMAFSENADASHDTKAAHLAELEHQADELGRKGKHAEAEVILRDLLQVRQTELGLQPDHPDIIRIKNNLGASLNNQYKCDEAEILHREVLESDTRVLGPEHPNTLNDLNNLAEVFVHQGKYVEALDVQQQAVKLSRKVSGVLDPDTLVYEENMANTWARQGQFDEAELMLEDVLVKWRGSTESEEHRGDMNRVMNNLASVLSRAGKYDEAEKLYRDLLPGCDDDLQKAISTGNLAGVLKDQGRFKEAEEMYRDILKLSVPLLGENDKKTLGWTKALEEVSHRHAGGEAS